MRTSDGNLLRRYIDEHSQDAFAELFRRHRGLVYWTCYRDLGRSDLAEDATQQVFLRLVSQASALRNDGSMPGWLYKTSRMVAGDMLKSEIRRRKREEKAVQEKAPQSDWSDVEPWLNNGLSSLTDRDREAIVLRYYENLSHQEIGDALGLTADAARVRVSRATERLRAYFRRHAIDLSAANLAVMLHSNAAPPVPPALTIPIPTAPMLHASSVSLLHLGAIAVQVKTIVAAGAAIVVLLIGTGVAVSRLNRTPPMVRHSPVTVKASDTKAVAAATQSNLAQIALNVIIYASAHKDTFDFNADNWRQKIDPQGKMNDLFFYPDSTEALFSVNPELSGRSSIMEATTAPRTVVAYEGSNKKLDFRHDGKAAVAFADGHVEMIGPGEVAKLLW